MIGHIYIDDDLIGEVDLKVIDASMGVVGGDLIPTLLYGNYQHEIQSLYKKNGTASVQDFNFKAIVQGILVDPLGGISITDSKEFNEILVDIAGVGLSQFDDSC